jgi:hypothetical protein
MGQTRPISTAALASYVDRILKGEKPADLLVQAMLLSRRGGFEYTPLDKRTIGRSEAN